MNHKIFYLHYGPGGNCDAERHFLAARHPHIEFWDQPVAASHAELVKACCQAYKDFSGEFSGSALMGHSFGCDLALAVAEELRLETDIYLVAPVHDIRIAFLNLATKVCGQSDIAKDLRDELNRNISQFQSSGTLDNLWALVFSAYKYPRIGELFWRNSAVLSEFAKVAGNFKPLNLEMWQKVLGDFLQRNSTTKAKWRAKVLLGEHDPYFSSKDASSWWGQLVGAENVTVSASAGHYPHLEDDKAFINLMSS